MGEDKGRGDKVASENAVSLAGRVSTAAELKVLPSGTPIVTFRLAMPRPPEGRATSRGGSDWVDCVAWSARTRRTVAGWRRGDAVAVEGRLRRRFFRGGDSPVRTRLEVEVLSGRRMR